MWVAFVDRSQLPPLLGPTGMSPSVTPTKYASTSAAMKELPSKHVAVVWDQNPRQDSILPIALVAHPPELVELFAWLVSYSSAIRPITSMIRVVDSATVVTCDGFPSTTRAPTDILSAMSGAVVGMNLERVASGGQFESDLSLLSCKQSAMWVLAKTIAMGYDPENVLLALRRWRNLSSRLPGPSFPWELDYAAKLGALLTQLTSKESTPRLFDEDHLGAPVVQLIYGVRELGKAFVEDLVTLGRYSGVSIGEEFVGEATREDKVKAFETMLSDLGSSRRKADAFTVSAIVGYVATRLSPGSLDHWSLVSQAASIVPGAILWYGLFAGLQGGGGQNRFLTSLTRRVMRELRSPELPWTVPKGDIDSIEYEMLTTGQGSPVRLDLSVLETVEVEVLPRVSFVLATPRRGAPKTTNPPFNALTSEIAETLEELEENITGADYVHRRLRRLLGELTGQRRPSSRRRPPRPRQDQ